MIQQLLHDAHMLAAQAESLGLIQEEDLSQIDVLVPNCRFCNQKLWGDTDELQDGKFCSVECFQCNEYEMMENEATGN